MPLRNVAYNLTSRIDELAKRKGVSMAQISLAWILSKPGVTAPIIGTTSLANLEDILGKSPEASLVMILCVGDVLMLACDQAVWMSLSRRKR